MLVLLFASGTPCVSVQVYRAVAADDPTHVGFMRKPRRSPLAIVRLIRPDTLILAQAVQAVCRGCRTPICTSQRWACGSVLSADRFSRKKSGLRPISTACRPDQEWCAAVPRVWCQSEMARWTRSLCLWPPRLTDGVEIGLRV